MPNRLIRRSAAAGAAALLALLGAPLAAHAQGETVDFSVDITQPVNGAPLPGDTDVTYSLTVANGGPDAATGGLLDTALSDGATVQSVTASDSTVQCDSVQVIVTCTIPSLASGASFTVDIVVHTPPGGVIIDSAMVGPTAPGVADSDPSNNGAVVINPVGSGGGGVADLALEMTADPNPATQNSDLTFTLTVTNNGDPTSGEGGGATVDDAQILDTLPLNATYSSSTPDGACSQQGGDQSPILTCTVDSLAPGASEDITITVVPQTPGAVINGAGVGSFSVLDPNLTNNGAVLIVPVNPAASPSVSPTTTSSETSGTGGTGPSTPIGGVQTGAGGTAHRTPVVPLAALTASVVTLGMLAVWRTRRRVRGRT